MRNLLSKHRIPSSTILAASDFLNAASVDTITDFNSEFGLTPHEDDALATARFAADAILKGAASVDKVVGYVAKRMLGVSPKAENKPVPVVMVGAPVVDTPDVAVVPVARMDLTDIREEVAPVVRTPGKRGRKRLGNSDFCKAVAAIEAAGEDAERQTILDCIVAQGIKQTSAVVYLWRYNKGERE